MHSVNPPIADGQKTEEQLIRDSPWCVTDAEEYDQEHTDEHEDTVVEE